MLQERLLPRVELIVKTGKCLYLATQSQSKEGKDLRADSVIINVHYDAFVEHELTFNTFLMLLIVDVSNDLTF